MAIGGRQSGAVGTSLGAAKTMAGGEDFKEKANRNNAKKRRGDKQFRLPGSQQMQAQQQSQQAKKFNGQPMTFANMQKQGVARPAPPALPNVELRPQDTAQRFRGGMMNATVPRVQQALQQPVPQPQANPALQAQVAGAMQQGQMQMQQPQGQLPQQVQQALGQPVQQQPVQPQPMQQSAVGGELQQRLIQQLAQLSDAPSAYQTEDIQQMREAQRADIEAQFGAQRQQLEEEMARRGLSASSIAAGQFGDLAGQQARAIATAEAGLTEKAAESLQRGREAAIQGLAQAAGVELEAKGLDLQSKKVQADIEAESQRLMQADRSLDLQQARDLAQKNIAFAQLKEQAAQRVSRENISMAELQQSATQFAERLGLDTRQVEASIEARTRELAQQDRTISLEEARFISTEEFKRQQLEENARQFDVGTAQRQSAQDIENELIRAQIAQILGGMVSAPAPAPTPQPGPVYNPPPPANAGGGGGGYYPPGQGQGQGGFE